MADPHDEADDFLADELTYWRFDEDERMPSSQLDRLDDDTEDEVRLAEARDEIRRSTR